MRSLSQVGQTSSSGHGGGPSGNSIAGPSGGGFSLNFSPSIKESAQASGIGLGIFGANAGLAALTAGELTIPYVGWVAAGASILFQLLDNLFGGSSDSAATPRQLLQGGRHPLYGPILGIKKGLTPTEKTAADDPPVYPTIATAVRGVAPVANARSLETGNESAGAIVPSGKGYTYTDPGDTHNPCGGYLHVPGNAVASYHTHPATCQGGVPEEPSPDDFAYVKGSRIPLYYITPSGKIFELPVNGPPRPLEETPR